MGQKKAKQVWVVGHRNPDTDSVCAAISYAHLKNETEQGAFIPKKAGSLSGETSYVLKRFEIVEPETIYHVGAQLKDIEFRRTKGVSGHYSLKRAWELMKEKDVVTLPIVNRNGRLEGVIVNGDIAYSYMDVSDNRILGKARTQFKNIIETLEGTLVTGNDHAYFRNGKVLVLAGSREVMQELIEEDDLVILGNVKENQMLALDKNVSCMIICGETDIDAEVIERAHKQECVLITTGFGSFATARLIYQSIPIQYYMTREGITTFQLDDYVDDVRDVMSKVRHRDFPILDEQRRYVGMVSRRNLMNMDKKRLILVDHNEKSQAVDGIDQADVLEIIDHHRLGSLETLSPIFFRNQPLGCTCTIIYHMYLEKGVEIPARIAGLMCAAILSDTLMFRSPTCTSVDEQAARSLAAIAGVEVEELAASMFEAGSDFKSKKPSEIIYEDFKTFVHDEISFGVAQVCAVSESQLHSIQPGLLEYLTAVLADKHLNMVFVMLTNILTESTELLCKGEGADRLISNAFSVDGQRECFVLPGVVSRKKQLIPAIMESLQEQE